MPALFCVFEGIDGSGKSTLLKYVAQRLFSLRERRGREEAERVLLLQEPSLLPSGRKIRTLLRAQTQFKAEKWLRLFLADRKNNLRKNINPNLKKGNWILQDRYFYSTAAYQGLVGKKGALSPQDILDYHLRKKFREPDFIFYLDLPPKLACQRLESSRRGQESFEKREYLEGVAQNYALILPKKTIHLNAQLEPEILCDKVMDSLPPFS